MKYIPGLNGLRAIAVFVVIFFHWGLPPFPPFIFLQKYFPNGNFGVNIFFVISGFLISSILLYEKNKAAENQTTGRKIIINFYVRRFLRIFPIYYITLLLLLFSSLPNYKDNFIYYLTYTENFHVYFNHGWDSFSHTWSLGVEEQFYIIWPCIIILAKKSWLVYVFIFFILIGPAFSFFQTTYLKPALNVFILTPSCFDAFGIGALIAYYYINKDLVRIKKWVKVLLPFSIFLFFYWIFAPNGGHFQYLKRFSDSIIATGLILFCLSDSYTSLRNKLLENKLMYHLGIVSYGIYLFHYAIPYFYSRAKQSLHVSFGRYDTIIDYTLMLLLLLLIAFISYFKIERPILKLKQSFKY